MIDNEDHPVEVGVSDAFYIFDGNFTCALEDHVYMYMYSQANLLLTLDMHVQQGLWYLDTVCVFMSDISLALFCHKPF